MRMIRRGHCLTCKPSVKDEAPFINKLFGHLLCRGLTEKQRAKLQPNKLVQQSQLGKCVPGA